ncbi:autophagy-related protein 13a-like [Apium graveolens]|uniref:autophagy-related protein 13a-like n=1 Tax=Apium graveolens TaxID=4045 RepID=UPI003D7A6A85
MNEVFKIVGRNDLSSWPTHIYGHPVPRHRLPNHYKYNSFDAYQLSPPFSPSTSPSPPKHLTGGNLMQSRLLSETSPVSIPHPMLERSPRYLYPNMSDTSRQSLPPPSPRNTKHGSSSQESSSGMRSLRKLDLIRTGELDSVLPVPYTCQKLSRDNKDESGRFSCLLSSSGSPRIGFSRSSSRLSFQDDLDDCDFSCPFIVDDFYTPDLPASQNLDGSKTTEVSSQVTSIAKKSHDAAVGELVHMFRTAPPLRQDSSCYSSISFKHELKHEAGSSSAFSLPRKTSDALEELVAYRDMKDLLLTKIAIVSANEEA